MFSTKQPVSVKIFAEETITDHFLPEYSTEGSSGMDLRSSEDLEIQPGEIKLVSTGLKAAIPEGFEIQIRPRSGLALKKSVTVLNTPGTIDSDYRGEIKVILVNLGKDVFTITRGDRIAQMVLAPVCRALLERVATEDELSGTQRGTGGFGSTGV